MKLNSFLKSLRPSGVSGAIAAITLLVAGFLGTAQADIQDSIADREGPTTKLSRGLANLVYGVTEIPMSIISENHDSHIRGGSLGVVDGVTRAFQRMGYGLYEVATFPKPTYQGTYRSPFPKRAALYPHTGYAEYPSDLGFHNRGDYTRSQKIR